MMENETPMSEQESLALITDMIQKAKGDFHDSGSSAILWGSSVAIAGLTLFAQRYFNFDIGFDIWLIVLVAIIPQIVITSKENKRRKVVGLQKSWANAVWTVYGISMLALVAYINIVPGVTDDVFNKAGQALFQKDPITGALTPFHPYIYSQLSLYLILFAIPTLVTGIARPFKPMLWGGIVCYALFVISCFTPFMWDNLLAGIAGIFNWLVPGIILRQRYLNGKGR